ncbi:Alpha-L-fucosidase 2 [Camellia lanceoleosa]|uniref:Alpha-L-fucosidase 2 n=1 Tax=Camellia lanceoleosa TaxID=1840588 RepID=A0ACC0H355_9ERIC|nr:Alpha-L-fucosidase 2 [Camellia lanceoleosa]
MYPRQRQNPDQVIVTKISGSKSGSLSFMVSLDSKLHRHSSVNGKNQIIKEGSCPGKRIPPKLNENDNPKGIQFFAILDLQISDVGTINVLDDNKLKIEGSDWAVMLLVASSSFDGPFTKPSDSKKDPTLESLSTFNLIKNLSYADLYSRHGIFGTQHLNINLQMNYWPSLPCNLHGCQEPLFDYILSLSVNGSKIAKIYGQKHLLIEVRLFGLYGKWVEQGFVLIYGSIILMLWTK